MGVSSQSGQQWPELIVVVCQDFENEIVTGHGTAASARRERCCPQHRAGRRRERAVASGDRCVSAVLGCQLPTQRLCTHAARCESVGQAGVGTQGTEQEMFNIDERMAECARLSVGEDDGEMSAVAEVIEYL